MYSKTVCRVFRILRGGFWDMCPPLKLLIDAQPELRPLFNFFPPPSFFFSLLVKCVNFIPNPYLAFHLYCQTRRNITENNKRLRHEIGVELMIFRLSCCTSRRVFPHLKVSIWGAARSLCLLAFLLEFSWRSCESLQIFVIFRIFPRSSPHRVGWWRDLRMDMLCRDSVCVHDQSVQVMELVTAGKLLTFHLYKIQCL